MGSEKGPTSQEKGFESLGLESEGSLEPFRIPDGRFSFEPVETL